jgi:hypothetical protein
MKLSFRQLLISTGLPAALAILTIVSSLPAIAIDRYAFKQLPHSGFGGKALGVALGDTNGDGKVDGSDLALVSGYTYDGAGRLTAAIWQSDGAGGFTLSSLLGLNGNEPGSIANAPAMGEDGAANAVGAARNPAGVWKPVLWREKADAEGLFITLQLPTLGGQSGNALANRGCMYPICGGWIVGRSDTQAGDSHATLWRETSAGVFEAVDLGTLGGSFSVATSTAGWNTDNCGHGSHILGRSTNAAGQMRACAWTSDDDGLTWTIHDLHPAGAAMSSLQGTSGDCDRSFSVGSLVSRTGRRVGYVAARMDAQWSQLFCSAPGFKNTDLTDVQRTRNGGNFIGSVWDDTDIVHAMFGAINWGDGAAPSVSFYPVNTLVDHPLMDDVAFLLSSNDRGAISGSYVEGGIEGPMILLATGDLLGHIRSIQGKPEVKFGDPDLWRAIDGRTLQITPSKKLDPIAVELSYAEDENGDGDFEDRGEHLLSVRARAFSRVGPDIHDNFVQHEVFNFQSGAYEPVGDPVALGGSSGYEVWNQPLGANHAHPITGEIRVRITFTGSRLKAVEIDEAILRRTP